MTRTLVLGGTVFLGRHVAAEALARGHKVTLFTRGIHGAGLFPEAQRIVGDRSVDVSALRDEWDVVIDTSGYKPADVAASCAAVRGAHYVFVSSCNAYPGWPEEAVDEDTPTWESDEDDYGPSKAACEREGFAALGDSFATVRAGLIVGPYDGVYRLPWWVERIARGGEVPAPGDPDRPMQIIDARDLAAFLLDLGERRVGGAFNGTGPIGMTSMRELLEAAVDATGSGARLRWIGEGALERANVEPWMELPLWGPWPGTWQIGTERAQAAGLRCRPAPQSVADVAAWLREDGEISDWGSHARPAPMSAEREAELLRAT